MKALSLTQPWASLMACGAKKMETRSWNMTYRGRIAIHAAIRFPLDARKFAETPLVQKYLPQQHVYPLGMIVATADLVWCHGTHIATLRPREDEDEYVFGDYSPGRFMAYFDEVIPVEPVPCKGALGFWDVPESIVDVLVALPGARSGENMYGTL